MFNYEVFMNLEDFNVEFSDDFVGSVFGAQGQLEVCARQVKNSPVIKYLVKCTICAKDPELFGEGYFSSTKSHLSNGKYPCGCSSLPKLNREQTLLKLNRFLKDSTYKFIRVIEEWKATRTRIVCSCEVHGEQPDQSLMDVLAGRKCRECRVSATTKANTVSDDIHIPNFMSTGAYHPDSKFWRSERKTPHKKYREGTSVHWWVYCGECNSTVETLFTTLKMGGLSCECSSYNQKFSYIHLIKDLDIEIALKFGISNDVHRRFKGQQNATLLNLENVGVWEFEDSSSCKSAERFLKNTIPCGIVSKELLPDGHSETTYLNKIDTIIKVFEDYGGVFVNGN
jgi:hypothetical protein